MGYGNCRHRMTRRTFLLGAGSGMVLGGLGGCRPVIKSDIAAPSEPIYIRKQFTGKCVPVVKPEFPLPGRYPGRVVEVHNPHSVIDGAIKLEPVRAMLGRAMTELTGAPNAVDAWRSFFTKGDRVGIKVNPVGYARQPGVVGVISSFAVIMAVVEGLKSAGVEQKDIVLFERYAEEFRAAGYATFVARELPDVRWYASAVTGGPIQTDLQGRDPNGEGVRPDPDPHVIGYDRDVFCKLDYCSPAQSKDDPLRFESHVGKIVTGDLVNKIITLPLLKDHRSAGITIALKNMSHGMVNNVWRTHIGPGKGENHCDTFPPAIVAQPAIRQKCVLHILDALICVFEGGPGTWNDTWGTWEHKSLFAATDPVAMDHVGWDVLDAERARRYWAPVGKMGIAGNNRFGKETFYLRTPEHAEIAGTKYQLGIFDPAKIEYKRVQIG